MRSDLEGEGRERLFLARLAREDGFLVVQLVADDLTDVQRSGQVVDDGVEHGLNALVLERGATEHGVQLGVDGQLADGALDLGDRELLTAEVLLHELFVGLGDGLEQLLAVLGGLVGELGGDLLDRGRRADRGDAAPGERLHLDEVDDTFEVVLGTDRNLQDQWLGAETVDDGLHGEEEVRAHLVHLVDEADAGDVVLGSLAPDLLGLGLDALLAVEHGNGAVEDAQRPLDLDREVDVAGCVDDVDLVVVPETGDRSGGDGDTTLLLLLHPVGGGSTVVGLTDLVVHTGVEEDALGRRGLAGIDVRHDADVADLVQVGQHFLCHR